jgi:hypothetical protein
MVNNKPLYVALAQRKDVRKSQVSLPILLSGLVSATADNMS